MDTKTVICKPFVVEATEITEENLEEVASIMGSTVEQLEDGTRYIFVNRRVVPNVSRVFPGFYMTKMGDNIHCYTKKLYNQKFYDWSEEAQAWIDFMNGKKPPKEEAEVIEGFGE